MAPVELFTRPTLSDNFLSQIRVLTLIVPAKGNRLNKVLVKIGVLFFLRFDLQQETESLATSLPADKQGFQVCLF